MAQPQQYTRQANFTDFQTSNPSSPHSGTSLDSEFNALKTTVDQIRTNIAAIQRDDAKLANTSVHAESLSNAVLALIKATSNGYGVKGAWTASTAYAVGDLVENSQATYLCFEAHTSGSTFGANSSKFILLANAAIQTTASAVDKMNGDGSTTVFNLTNNAPSGATDVLVFVNGSLREPTGDYTVTNTQITFTTAPSAGTNNVIVWGTSTAVEAAKQAALSARDTAETHRDDANEHKTTANRWAVKVDGTVVDADTSVDSNEYSSKSYATSESTPTTIYVTVAGGKFVLNGKTISSGSDSIYNVIKGTTYTFDVSDSTNNNHPLNFSISAEDATPDYSVTRNGTPGQAGATVVFAVPSDAAATIYFYCGNHSGMGATLTAITESYAPSAGSAKEWATKTDGQIASEYSSKMYAQETSGDHSHGGSSKGWAQTAKDTQVPGAASTDRSAKHYSEVASDHKTDAEAAKTAAEAAFDSFDDRYLGAKSSEPSVDNDGNALLAGALYWNSTSNGLFIYNGSNWQTVSTSVGGNTITSTSGNDLSLVTPSNSNNVVINSGSNSIQLPNVRAPQDNYVLAMSNTSTGETSWQATQVSPTISGITSGQLNSYYDADGTTVSNDKGGTLVVVGTDFGTNISNITAVRICASDGTSQVNATTLGSLSDTSITATWNGTESGYSTFSGVYYVEIVKSGLTSNRFNSAKSFSGDPTISSVTGTGGEGDNVTVTSSNLGSYGGVIAGGGQDSNTKLLLNFDRTGGTDIEDSSNVGGDGHKVTASGNAVIKSSPFGDGKSAIYFSGSSDKLVIADHDDFTIGTNDFTFEFWINLSSAQNWKLIAGFGMPESGNTTALTLGTDSGGNIEVEWNDSGTSEHILNGYQAGRWYHIAISRQTSGGTTTSKAFIDGVGKDITIPATLNNPSGGMNFGSGSGDYTGHFVGWLDEIRFVNGTGVYRDNFDVPTSRFSASDEANTKLLIHSNDDFTAIPKTQNSSTSSVGGWSTHGESGGSGNSVAVNGDSLRHTTGSTGVQVWTTRQITGLDQNKKYSASCKIEACSETPAVSLYIGSGDNQTRSSTFSGITGNLGDDTSGNAVGKRLATDAWSPPASGTVYMTVITNQNANNTCDINEWRIHNWDDASSSDHTITTTGSHHSSAHGGIAPAMTWPASLKQTGSAGVYFDGGSDSCLKIDATTDNGNLSELNLGNNTDFTIDCWVYFNSVSSSQSLFSRRHNKSSGDTSAWWLEIVSGTAPVALRLRTQETATTLTSSTVIYPNRWHHITLNRDVSNSNLITLYVDATSVGTYNSYAIDMEDGTPNANQDFLIGGVYSTGNIVDELNGYIDLFRYVKGSCITPTANPTQIYGAMFPVNPSVGTITITGATTDSTDIAFTEINNSLPNGLTLNDQGAGNQTATITGTLTDSVSSDTTTSNIRIQAKANNDANRITEVNENYSGASTAGAGNLSITKKAGGKPVLFNARRYIGTSTVRDINGYGFQPDLVWFKIRNQNYHHALFDSVRGGYGFLESDRNVVENTANTNTLNAYNADGFELGTDGTWYLNKTNEKYIAWAWKAGGAPSGNGKKIVDGTESNLTSGTDYSASDFSAIRQSVNTSGDFSITTYTGNGSTDGWFKHGLSGTPDWVIIKSTSSTYNWIVWHSGLNSGSSTNASDYIQLNASTQKGYYGGSANTSIDPWAGSGYGITSDKINLNYGGVVLESGQSYVCYAWKAVSGVSAFGSYTGGGAGSTVTVTTGFSPRFIMIKAIDSTGSAGDPDWAISDVFTQETGTSNQGTGNKNFLRPNVVNGTLADSAYGVIEYTSTAFKVHSENAWDLVSDSGATYIYMAFA